MILDSATNATDAAVYDDAASAPDGATVYPFDAAHFVDGWTPVPWASTCKVYQATTPAALATVAPVEWVPCQPSRAGCEEVAINFPTPPKSPTPMAAFSFARTGAGVELAFWRGMADGGYREYDVWDSVNGIVTSFRIDGDLLCQEHVNVGGDEAVFTVGFKPDNSSMYNYTAWGHVVGSPASITALTATQYLNSSDALGLGGTFYYPVVATRSTIVYYAGLGGAGVLFDRQAKTGEVLRLGDAAVGFGPDFQARGDTLFYSTGDTIGLWQRGIGAQVLIQRPGVSVHDVATDGSVIVWLETTDPNAGATVYSAPYATDPSAIHGTPIGHTACPALDCSLRLADGYATMAGQASGVGTALIVIRVADGKAWQAIPAADENWYSGWFAAVGYLWTPWGITGAQQGMRRFDLASLGGAP